MPASLKRQYQSLRGEAPSKSGLRCTFLTLEQVHCTRLELSLAFDKARGRLGYRPAFDLDHGMTLTGEWAQRANPLSAEG
jgi:hypothetical protein